MKIALFDYSVTEGNAIGKCHQWLLKSLCWEHEFTVFSVDFENPCPERIEWVRVPAVKRPLVLLYVTFHVLAPLSYLWRGIRRGGRFELVQMVESNLLFGDIAYSHFCHRAFLKRHWAAIGTTGVRGFLRWLDHRLHAAAEPWAYRRAKKIVVPSRGLARELAEEYPFAASKITVLPNPVDLERMARPQGFNATGFRRGLGFEADDLVLAFVALGQYERKGLPLLLEALAQCGNSTLRLVVVGGTDDLVGNYQARVDRMGLSEAVVFTGMQRDVRPYLWAADALALPSHYEVFPLVALEAAAAGLPLLTTRLNGIEEFLKDGVNGFLVRDPESGGCRECLLRLSSVPVGKLREMGRAAQEEVRRYGFGSFFAAWSGIYAGC